MYLLTPAAASSSCFRSKLGSMAARLVTACDCGLLKSFDSH